VGRPSASRRAKSAPMAATPWWRGDEARRGDDTRRGLDLVEHGGFAAGRRRTATASAPRWTSTARRIEAGRASSP
jgi:hypothetical protein